MPSEGRDVNVREKPTEDRVVLPNTFPHIPATLHFHLEERVRGLGMLQMDTKCLLSQETATYKGHPIASYVFV